MNNPFDFSQFYPKYDPQDMMRQMQSAFAGFSAPRAPSFDISSLTDAQKKNLESLVESNTKAVECTQQLMQKQMELFQQALKDGSEASASISQVASNPQDAAQKQTEVMHKAFEQALQSSSQISDLITKAQEEMTEIISKRVQEGMDEIKRAVKSN
jgi:phasin family protein